MQGFPPVGFADGIFDNRFLNINGRPYDFPAAYSQQWNFTLGRQIRDYAIEAAYVGNKANKLMANRNINQPTPGPGSVNSRRIFPGWGSITFQEPRGTRSITGCKPKWRRDSRSDTSSWCPTRGRKRSTIPTQRNFQLRVARATCRTSSTLRAERSRSFQDVRHRLVLKLPLGTSHRPRPSLGGSVSPGWNRLVGGWQINGITSYQSGRAFTISSPFDHSNTGSSNIRPDATGISPDLPSEERSVQRWINAAAFAYRMVLHSGTQVEMSGQVRRSRTSTFPLFKDIPFDTEGKRKLQFRAEFFNIMNTPQFQIPNRTFNTPQFGTITETVADNRDVQLALRFIR